MKKRFFYLLPAIVLAAGIWFSCERSGNNGDPYITTSYDMKCKGNDLLLKGSTASDYPCINYGYDGDSVLTFTHTNASFNCCPESFKVDIEVKGDSLIITEDDSKQLCKCNCIYDLEIKVHELSAGTNHVKIVEPYFQEAWPKLLFDIDLKKEPEGRFCVTRPEGWWR
jgi:hypothetical protein